MLSCFLSTVLLHENIDQTLVNSIHGLLNIERGVVDCCVITTEYKHLSIEYTCNTFCVMH